ncbi:MAG TPA: plastocyanin/azurin family copper-binding protein [Dehalococcoidia bacterium]|nr:plastocyanin/azurin family copper-binding protein [Dehalococcoidia bacterium]HLB28778.1 plastocyanin/azurin family copper-binding protein [Dehalococcoidia bacterium]
MRIRSFALGLIAALALLGAFLDGPGGARAVQQVQAISIGDNFFAPANVTVPVGTTVRWTHNGSLPHTVTSETGVFDSGTTSDKYLRSGATFQFTFTQPGSYPYYCFLHRALGMVGTITVAQVTPTPGATTPPAATPTPAATATPGPAAAPTAPTPVAPVTGTGAVTEDGFPWWLVALPAGIALLIAGGLLGLRRRLG